MKRRRSSKTMEDHEQAGGRSFWPKARRVIGWTCNLTATALIVVGGFTLGREALQWWSGAARAPGGVAGSLGRAEGEDLWRAPTMEFGDFPLAFRRTTLRGDKPELLAELRRACREAARDATPPRTAPGPAERRWLERIAGETPVETVPGVCELYQLDGPIPLTAAVRATSDLGVSGGSQETVPAGRRVVCWGLGAPLASESSESETAWSVFICATDDGRSTAAASVGLPPPSEGRRVMSLRSERGGALLAFRGGGRAEDWTADWTRRAQAGGWRVTSPWARRGGVWRADLADEKGRRADLLVATQPDGALWAMAAIDAAPSDAR